MDGVPLDAIPLEVVLVETFGVVLAVQVSFETVVEPPGAVVLRGARVVVPGKESGQRVTIATSGYSRVTPQHTYFPTELVSVCST